MCDINARSKNWICSVFGHQHVRSEFGLAQLVPEYCVRCFANTVTSKGDSTFWCKVFGHKDYKTIIGDSGDSTIQLNACVRCHAKV